MKVTEVLGSRKWPSDEDTKVIYWTLKLDGVDGTVSVGHKPGGKVPQVGTPYDGWTIEEDAQGRKKLKAPSGGFNGGARGPKDPAERRSIQMQHAQKCAVEALKLAAEHGPYEPPNAADVATHVEAIAKRLFDQVEGVAK